MLHAIGIMGYKELKRWLMSSVPQLQMTIDTSGLGMQQQAAALYAMGSYGRASQVELHAGLVHSHACSV